MYIYIHTYIYIILIYTLINNAPNITGSDLLEFDTGLSIIWHSCWAVEPSIPEILTRGTGCVRCECFRSYQQLPLRIWVWVKIRCPNNWMVNTKLDIHICGPTSVFHFDPHPYNSHRDLWDVWITTHLASKNRTGLAMFSCSATSTHFPFIPDFTQKISHPYHLGELLYLLNLNHIIYILYKYINI